MEVPLQVSENPPPNCTLITAALDGDGYDLYGCDVMLTGAWGEVMRGFVYGATVKATCTQNPKFFVDLFEKAWKGDTFKITFDSLFNRKTSKWMGGFHHRDHYVIVWRKDLRADYLVHEVTHHRYPGMNESWVKRTAY